MRLMWRLIHESIIRSFLIAQAIALKGIFQRKRSKVIVSHRGSVATVGYWTHTASLLVLLLWAVNNILMWVPDGLSRWRGCPSIDGLVLLMSLLCTSLLLITRRLNWLWMRVLIRIYRCWPTSDFVAISSWCVWMLVFDMTTRALMVSVARVWISSSTIIAHKIIPTDWRRSSHRHCDKCCLIW